MSRIFTLSEAQTLLPVAEALLLKAQAAGRRVAEIGCELQQLNQRIFLQGGMHLNILVIARQRAEHDKAAQEAQDTLEEMNSIGVQVKDLDKGLLDFPSVLDGKPILLCWKLGEKEIAHWHSPEDGFAGRKPIGPNMNKEHERLN